jgi:HPt (histidine-containing phosphotransfer) domain-containing protein
MLESYARASPSARCCERIPVTILEGTSTMRHMDSHTPANTSADPLPPTDAEALARLERFGGAKLLHEMIALFLANAPGRLDAAATALAAGDATGAENALHSLKSSSAQLGALRLSRLCEQGEAIARGGRLDGIDLLIAHGREELARVEAWLTTVRAGGAA